MGLKLERLLHTSFGRNLLSIIIGIGLATLFRKACTDRNCIRFDGPVIDDIENKTFKHNGKCYQYEAESVSCNQPNKQTIDISPPPSSSSISSPPHQEVESFATLLPPLL